VDKIKVLGRSVDWSKVSPAELIKALRLYDHASVFYDRDILDLLVLEIQRRAIAGDWIDLENPPPPLHNVPGWLAKWPWRLLSKQADVVAFRSERRNLGERVVNAPRT
jgi:hypothetical protein